MIKKYEKLLANIGFIRCNHCGNYTPHQIYTVVEQRMVLGISVGKQTKEYILVCKSCEHEKIITQHEVDEYLQMAKERMPYQKQQRLWKSIYRVHKNLSIDKDVPKDLKTFFKQVKKEVKLGLLDNISDDDFIYIFNAYLTNLTNASRKNKRKEKSST